jgi:hypothetical protein
MYYTSMLRCCQLLRILVRTNHPCLRVGRHTTPAALSSARARREDQLHFASSPSCPALLSAQCSTEFTALSVPPPLWLLCAPWHRTASTLLPSLAALPRHLPQPPPSSSQWASTGAGLLQLGPAPTTPPMTPSVFRAAHWPLRWPPQPFLRPCLGILSAPTAITMEQALPGELHTVSSHKSVHCHTLPL